jgi:hypothetical protein
VQSARFWTDLFYFLCGENILEMERATKLTVTTAFNYLAKRKTRAAAELMEAEKYKTKYNLR